MMNRYVTILGAGLLAGIVLMCVLGVVLSPVRADREAFEYQVQNIEVPDIRFGDAENPEFNEWQLTIATHANLWQPLFRPRAQEAPPPNLAQQLNGVIPTRNEIGTGPSRKIQIVVDGQPAWYVVGQQIRGCEIKEFTDSAVVFAIVQGGTEYRIALPQR